MTGAELRYTEKLREMIRLRPPGEVYQVELAILELADRLGAVEARLKADDAALAKVVD